MEMNEYQKLAMRTDDPNEYKTPINRLINGVMGLNGEAGEVIDLVKKAIYQGHELKKDDIVNELGDVLWYLAECADTLGITLSDIADANVLKLVKRFPDGFSKEASVNRAEPETGEVIDDTNGEPDMSEMRDES